MSVETFTGDFFWSHVLREDEVLEQTGGDKMSVLFELEGSCSRRFKIAAAEILVLMLFFLERSNAASTTSSKKSVEAPPSANVTTVGSHYKSNVEMEAALQNFTQICSHISRLYTIGNSSLGVPLWALEISDEPGVPEPEPAFKYVCNMHGDEPLGRHCDCGKLHLHLLPSMNPDGFVALPKPRRNNAHNIDLNRDFPNQFFLGNDVEENRQAETRPVMGWIRSTLFTASASFHEGALVANYRYDGNPGISQTYASLPDDTTFKFLAGVYAYNHPLMFKSKESPGGVTNGAAWYPVYGGMQDWNYLHGNCLELTLEMNDKKWPPFTQVSQIWNEHRKSMLELVAATVTSGVHGRVMSSRGGKPLAATITVSGIRHSMNASAGFGDYHRLLAPGQVYEVTASMAGYSSTTTSAERDCREVGLHPGSVAEYCSTASPRIIVRRGNTACCRRRPSRCSNDNSTRRGTEEDVDIHAEATGGDGDVEANENAPERRRAFQRWITICVFVEVPSHAPRVSRFPVDHSRLPRPLFSRRQPSLPPTPEIFETLKAPN